MIEISLLPEELRKKERIKVAMPEIPIKKTLFISLGVLVSFQLLFTLFTFFLYTQEISLTKNVVSLKESSKDVIAQKEEAEAIYNRLKEIRSVVSRKFYWSELLSSVSNSATKGVWLRNLSVTDQGPKPSGSDKASTEPQSSDKDKKAAKDMYLVLEGSAVGQGQETAFIGKYLKQLKETPYFTELFSEIKPNNINQRRFKDFDVYDFTIHCKFRKEKTG